MSALPDRPPEFWRLPESRQCIATVETQIRPNLRMRVATGAVVPASSQRIVQ